MLFEKLSNLVQRYPETQIYLVPLLRQASKKDTNFDKFLDAIYDGGKTKITNPDPENRKKYPRIEVVSARSYPPYEEQLQKEYRAWLVYHHKPEETTKPAVHTKD